MIVPHDVVDVGAPLNRHPLFVWLRSLPKGATGFGLAMGAGGAAVENHGHLSRLMRVNPPTFPSAQTTI